MSRGRRAQFDAHDLINRYATGESLQSLCKLYRADRNTIRGILCEHGVQPRGHREAMRLAVSVRGIDEQAIVARYAAGESVNSLSLKLKLDQYVVRRVLRDRGVALRSQAQTARLRRTARIEEGEVVRRYLSGESVKHLSRILGADGNVIRCVLRDCGVPRRGVAEANDLVCQRRTLAERQQRIRLPIPVWEGRSYPVAQVSNAEGLRKRAQTQQRTRSHQTADELDVLERLPVGWVDHQQLAVDRYNIDFAHGSVAVEVHSVGLHPFRSEQVVSRAIDLANLGWHVVYFWPSVGSPARRITDIGVTELVSYAERLDSDPSPRRQYLVVRGGGEVITSGSFDLVQRSLIGRSVDAD